MKKRIINIGVVGTGFIAQVISNMLHEMDEYNLYSVCSRSLYNARIYRYNIEKSDVLLFNNVDKFLGDNALDAIYVATPTSTREAICLKAIEYGKSVLVEKPFISQKSYKKMLDFSNRYDIAFLDATHFAHNHRMRAIKKHIKNGELGKILSVRSMFSFPQIDKESTQYNLELEPKGALADLGWYPIRAFIYCLSPDIKIKKSFLSKRVCCETGVLKGAHGFVELESSEILSFDVGYDMNYVQQYLEIAGDNAMIRVNDFVIPYKHSFVYKENNVPHGYQLIKGIHPVMDQMFFPMENKISQHQEMLNFFYKLHFKQLEALETAKRYSIEVLKTMGILDHIDGL